MYMCVHSFCVCFHKFVCFDRRRQNTSSKFTGSFLQSIGFVGKKLDEKKYLANVFALSSKLSLATITFADVQNCSTIEISTGKEVESSGDLAKTLSYSAFLHRLFFF